MSIAEFSAFCRKSGSAWRGDLVDIKDVLLGNSEYSLRIMGVDKLLLHYCIAMQAIWCVKFWNMTKSGGQFALASPTPNSGELVPLSHRDLRPWA